VIYKVTTPATATAPEGLRRVTNNQIVGGKCYVGMEVEISAGGYLFNRFFSLKLTEDPDSGHSVTHPGAQDHIYFQLAASRPEGASSVGIPGVPAANQPRWQLWNGSLEKWEEAPQAHGPLDHRSAQRERWRVLIPWQTTIAAQMPEVGGAPGYSTLLGHNGSHTFKVNNMQDSSLLIQNTSTATFSCDELTYGNSYNNYAMSHSVEIDKATDKANVQNMKLAGVTSLPGNGDYFKFAGGDEREIWRQPQVKFHIVDENETQHSTSAKYLWKVRLRSTDVDNEEWAGSIVISGIANAPGQITAFINDQQTQCIQGQTQVKDELSDPNADHTVYAPLDDAGTYTFDISVQKLITVEGADQLLDKTNYRSAVAYWPHRMPQPNETHSGHGGNMAFGTDGIERYKVKYFLQDKTQNLPLGSKIKDLKIEMLSPDWEDPIAQSDNTWGDNLKTPYFDKLLKTFTEPRAPGMYITLFRAKDGHAADYRDHLDKPVLVKNDRDAAECEVIEVTPNAATKVLISAKHGGGYPNAAQTKDAEITVTAKVRYGGRGQMVYFEVIDPRDASPYNQSQAPNDNRDTTKSGTQGYAAFQQSCLSKRQVKLGDPGTQHIENDVWTAKTTLLITKQYAGDNYQVRATGRKSADATKPFDLQPTTWGGSYKTSGALVAWKRIYLEVDRMYKKGASLTAFFKPDADTDDDKLYVDNTVDFNIGDDIVLWNRSEPPVETKVKGKTDITLMVADVPAGTIMVGTNPKPQDFPNYSGVKLKNNDEVYDAVSTRFLPQAFGSAADGSDGGTFVEFREDVILGWNVPKYTKFPGLYDASTFCGRWFKGAQNGTANIFQLLTSLDQETGNSGVSSPPFNTATVHTKIFDHEISNAEIVVHEEGHLFDLLGMNQTNNHIDAKVDAENHQHNDHCIMSYNNVVSNGITEFDWNATATYRNDCLFLIRNGSDPK
jgi:hypothetical protein